MNSQTETQKQLAALAAHLGARHTAILEAWRAVVDNDLDLTTGSSLSRTQFNDHIPVILNSFARRLQAWPEETSILVQEQEHKGITSHGLHRWQQGFRLRELTREWGYLQLCVVDEVESYARANPGLDPTAVTLALRALTHLCVAGVSDSADAYWQLHQTEAASHVHALEQALAELNALENARSIGWHQATHDLRGSVTVVTAATQMLDMENITEAERQQVTSYLEKGMLSLRDMLNNLTDLARLEAGHEQRTLAPFDASVLLHDFCLTMRPVADSQGLYLRCEGPDSLPVEGDRAKVQRILQNLVLNALKYTQQGGLVVRWESRKESDADRWMVSVQDTGPGFHADSSIAMANHLRDATQESHEIEDNAIASGTSSNEDKPAVTLSSQSPRRPLTQQAGEGIGLSIVKGLCDLLDATLELETGNGQGSTFRVTFPSFYQHSAR